MEPGRYNAKASIGPQRESSLTTYSYKIGFFKQLVIALKPEEGNSMRIPSKKIPALSEAKIKKGVFVGPQIRKLVMNDKLSGMPTDVRLAAWNSFKEISSGSLGKHRAEKHRVQRYCINIGRKL